MHAGTFGSRYRLLRFQQRFLVDQLLFVVPENLTQQHGGKRVGQQQHPPGLFNEGIAGPIGNLRECRQLSKLHDQTQCQIVNGAR